MPMDLIETRALTIELSESDWRALRTVERDPVAYLKAQIRRRLGGEGTPVVGTPRDYSESDE